MSKPTTRTTKRETPGTAKAAAGASRAAKEPAQAARKTVPAKKTPRKPDGNPTVSARRTAADKAPGRQPRAAKPQPVPVPKAITTAKKPASAPAEAAASPAAAPGRPLFRKVTMQASVQVDGQDVPAGVPPPASTGAASRNTGTPVNHDVPRDVPAARRPLTFIEERFAFEYVQDGNATRAYMRATRNTNERSASVQASRLLADPNIRAKVEEERRALQQRSGVTAEKLLQRLAAIAFADPRELMDFLVESCRYCHGEGHQYHRTAIEYEFDRMEWETHGRQRIGGAYLSARKAKQRESGRGGAEPAFEHQGGPGFDPAQPPHPHCPQCHGHGVGRPVFKDTRLLSPAAAALFAGVKEGKEGLEVKLLDPMAAMEKIARHIGFYEADNRQKPMDAFTAMLASVSGPNAALPIVPDPDGDDGV